MSKSSNKEMRAIPENNYQHDFVISAKLPAARGQEKISLREVAAKADMSASMLSQIENSKAFPSVRSI